MDRILEITVEEIQICNPREVTLSRQLMSCSCSPWIKNHILQTKCLTCAEAFKKKSSLMAKRADTWNGIRTRSLSTGVLPTWPCVAIPPSYLQRGGRIHRLFVTEYDQDQDVFCVWQARVQDCDRWRLCVWQVQSSFIGGTSRQDLKHYFWVTLLSKTATINFSWLHSDVTWSWNW